MKPRRVILIAGLLFASAGIVIVVLVILDRQPGVTKPNFDRIEIGMTRETVGDLLGSDSQGSWTTDLMGPWAIESMGHPYLLWRANDGTKALVVFKDNRVIEKWWVPSN